MPPKRANSSTESLHASKRLASDITDEQEPQIIPKSANKTSWVWDYFVEKTDGRVYCQYIEKDGENEIVCGASLLYKTQTSSMSYHLGDKHKMFNKKKEQQLKIDDQIKKFTPHKEPKQQYLRNGLTDWLVTDGRPFATIVGEGFKRFIKRVDPAFIVPCYRTLKADIGAGYQEALLQMKQLINETCTYAAITTDLWTARNNQGYIGITGHWLTPNMELYDILICIDLIKYPHTAENIRLALVKKIQELHLNDKVKHAVTDNGANVVKAIREWDGVDRIACTSHTLQRAQIEIANLNKEITRQTLTSSDRELQDSNEPINIPGGSLQILRTIADCKTRWGSTLASWKRLLELKEAIKRTLVTLRLDSNSSAIKDWKKLRKRYLKDCEWKLLEELCKLFQPIERATTFLGGEKYCTISLIYSTLESIRFYYTPLIEDDDENEEGIEDDDDELEDDDEESDDEDEGESESDEEEEDEQRIRPNVTTRQQSQHQQLQQQSQQQQSQHQQHQQQPQRQHHQQQLNTASIINKVQKEIYGALFDYWNDPPMAMLLATILDPRCKRTHGWPNELRERVKVELKVQYDEIKPQNNTQPEENFSNNNSSIDRFHAYIFGPQVIEENEDTEFDNYFRTPQASYDTNPFQWWQNNKDSFPVLYELARKYLCIPATSVPSERLFSDAGNQICEERNRLKASTVTELLFLKRNSEYFNVFK
ncbi:hypothetical protein RclHR1_03510004 [Rhizophagus clarus]|uniref:HAT C-terminal dimerisation domain-containing protein n=1 Tax=Rhizophagus clarus TaxID=94130 RepID=A0A2Z6RBU2_9GLOM|nr:hypothetical protein RclHR1_03510004 [Rhizophagus clarus]